MVQVGITGLTPEEEPSPSDIAEVGVAVEFDAPNDLVIGAAVSPLVEHERCELVTRAAVDPSGYRRDHGGCGGGDVRSPRTADGFGPGPLPGQHGVCLSPTRRGPGGDRCLGLSAHSTRWPRIVSAIRCVPSESMPPSSVPSTSVRSIGRPSCVGFGLVGLVVASVALSPRSSLGFTSPSPARPGGSADAAVVGGAGTPPLSPNAGGR